MAKASKPAPSAAAAPTAAPDASASTASTGIAGQSQTRGDSSSEITVDNIEARLSSLLQPEPEAAATPEPTSDSAPDAAGQEPSPAEEEAPSIDEQPGEEQPAPEAESDDDPNAPEWYKKRVDKLTAQKHELREKLEEVQAKMADLEKKIQEPTPEPAATTNSDNPLAGVKTETELQRKESEAKSLLKIVNDQLIALRRNPAAVERFLRASKVEIRNEDGEEDFSRDSIEAYLLQAKANIETTVQEYIPQRRQHLQAAQRYEALAAKSFPFLSKPDSPEYAVAQEVIRHFPGVKARPDWQVFVGVHTLGLLRLQELQKGKSAAPAAKPAPRIAAATAIPQRDDPRKAQQAAAREKLLKGDAHEYVKAALGDVALV